MTKLHHLHGSRDPVTSFRITVGPGRGRAAETRINVGSRHVMYKLDIDIAEIICEQGTEMLKLRRK